MDELLINVDEFTPLTEDKGVLKKIVKPGKIDLCPVQGDNIVLQYNGTFFGGDNKGKPIHSAPEGNEKINFRIGKSVVFSGWDIALPTMQMGEICQLVLSPQYAHEDGNSCFFEMELLDFHGDDICSSFRGSVFLTQVERGNPSIPVRPGANCEVSLKEYASEKYIGERTIKYVVGDYECNNLPKGIDFALTQMYDGEKGRIKVARDMGYPEEWYVDHGVSIDSSLYYVVEVISCEQRKTPSVFKTFDEKMNNMKKWKERANHHFKNGKFTIAADMYQDLIEDMTGIIASTFDETHKLQSLKCTLLQNRALVYLKMKLPEKCLEECKKCFQIDENNVKCLYREGEAYLLVGDHEEAEKCFKKVLKIDPQSAAAMAKVKFCQEVISEQLKKENRMFKAAFKQLVESKEDTDPTAQSAVDHKTEQPQTS